MYTVPSRSPSHITLMVAMPAISKNPNGWMPRLTPSRLTDKTGVFRCSRTCAIHSASCSRWHGSRCDFKRFPQEGRQSSQLFVADSRAESIANGVNDSLLRSPPQCRLPAHKVGSRWREALHDSQRDLQGRDNLACPPATVAGGGQRNDAKSSDDPPSPPLRGKPSVVSLAMDNHARHLLHVFRLKQRKQTLHKVAPQRPQARFPGSAPFAAPIRA